MWKEVLQERAATPDKINEKQGIKNIEAQIVKVWEEAKKAEKEMKKEKSKDYEDTSFIWKRFSKMVMFATKMWIVLGDYSIDLVTNVVSEVAKWIIPDGAKKFVKENFDDFSKWYIKNTKRDEIRKVIDEIYISWFTFFMIYPYCCFKVHTSNL